MLLILMEKWLFSTQCKDHWIRNTRNKNKARAHFITSIKINFRLIQDANVKNETIWILKYQKVWDVLFMLKLGSMQENIAKLM